MTDYGFADQHGQLISYVSCRDYQHAGHVAADFANRHGGPVEYWRNERDDDGDLPPSRVAEPDRDD